jgi:hypothetical protein
VLTCVYIPDASFGVARVAFGPLWTTAVEPSVLIRTLPPAVNLFLLQFALVDIYHQQGSTS